jgi:hypothetical protein
MVDSLISRSTIRIQKKQVHKEAAARAAWSYMPESTRSSSPTASPALAAESIAVLSASDMAHGLGLKVTAEGVETEEQVGFLRKLGCDYLQGYLISHPVPPNSISQTVAALDQFGAWSKLRGNSNT